MLFSLLFWIQYDSQTSHIDINSLGTCKIKSFRNKIDCWIVGHCKVLFWLFGRVFFSWIIFSKLAPHAYRRSGSIKVRRIFWFMFWGMWVPSKSEWASLVYIFQIPCCNMTHEAAWCGLWRLDTVTPFSKNHHGTRLLDILVSLSLVDAYCILIQNMKVLLCNQRSSPSEWLFSSCLFHDSQLREGCCEETCW